MTDKKRIEDLAEKLAKCDRLLETQKELHVREFELRTTEGIYNAKIGSVDARIADLKEIISLVHKRGHLLNDWTHVKLGSLYSEDFRINTA